MPWKRIATLGILGGSLAPFLATDAHAQEVDRVSAPNAVGVGMAKSIQQQLGGGAGDEDTPGSARYLIARDPARAIRRGRNLFQRKFKVSEGNGPRTGDGNGDINTIGSIGAGLADSCALCHGRPRGSAGFGGDVFTRPDSRDAPHLFGLGLQEMLADEITAELREIRDDAQAAGCSPATNPLFADNASQWSVQSGQNGTIANNPGGGIRVTLTGTGWAIIDSIPVGPLTGINTTVQFKLTIPPGVPSWASVGIAVSAPPTIGWQQFTVNPPPAPVAGGNTLSFNLPLNVRNALNNNPNASVHIIVQGNVGQQYVFDNIVMATGVPGGAGCPLVVPLVSKGINYGSISVDSSHVVDLSGVVGVNQDLRVRPFFAEGTTISMREFLVGAFNAEMGIQINDPIINAAAAGGTVVTPSGMVLDGTIDVFESSPTAEVTDPNANEPTAPGLPLDAGVALADFMEFYLLNYFKAGHYLIMNNTTMVNNANAGRSLFNQIGCNSCHIANLTVDTDRRVADVETAHRTAFPAAVQPPVGVFNNLFAEAEARFVVLAESGSPPKIVPAGDSFVVEDIFTDFKRHDLGNPLRERNFNNTIHNTFMTEALWGVGSSPPYGHDGRAINLNEIVERHAGEASAARTNFRNLTQSQRDLIFDFLNTLILFPPDDTASNLNVAGDIDPNNPDFPQRAHGNIRLPTLFQIASEGAE